MRNREAARYARWAAMAAGVIALVVAGTFIERSTRQSLARRAEHAVIPPAVEQQSSSFFLRSGEKGRTVFEVRASRATRFKGNQRDVLNDVTITMHGYKLDRDDSIEARECSYDPGSGAVRCAGPVRIELRPATGAAPAKGAPSNAAAAKPVEIQTSDLAFDSKTGDASTPDAVAFRFPQGSGRGTGIAYRARTATLRVARGVEFDLAPSPRTGGAPVHATGSALEIRRDERTLRLFGPVDVRQGGSELTAENVLVEMDKDFHARHVTAEGHPRIRSTENGKELWFSADRLEAALNGKGWVQSIAGEGDVSGSRRAKDSTEDISAAHFQMAMLPRGNAAQTLTASGNVVARSKQEKGSQVLRTEALRLQFAPPAAGSHAGPKQAARSRADGIQASQRIESAETLAPASIEANGAGEKATQLRANQFVARFDPRGRMQRLLGHGAVEVRQQPAGKQPQTITAPELEATFGSDGQLATLEDTGGVRVQQGDQQATSARLSFVQSPAAKSGSAQAPGVATLAGAPVLTDAESRTTVGGRVTIETGQTGEQKADEFRATGGVISTLLPPAQANGTARFSLGLGPGAAHVFADTLSGSASTGHLVYQGHARVWQGDAVLDADRIEIWRDQRKMEAMGDVALVFPQTGGPLAGFPGAAGAGPGAGSNAQAAQSPQEPKSPGAAVWQVRAASLTYSEAEQRIHFDGGVTAKSQDNSIQSQTLDAVLAPAAASQAQKGARSASGAAAGARQLSRIVAQGSVVVQQGTRRGSADRAEYTATDGKFVLSGGQPTLADADGNTVTGRSLTFFLTDDTILIDSQEGSRTLTKHRVEK